MDEYLNTLFSNYFSSDPSVAEQSAAEINELSASEEILNGLCRLLLENPSSTSIHELALSKLFTFSELILKIASEETSENVKQTALSIFTTENKVNTINNCKTIIEYFLVANKNPWPEMDEFMLSPESPKFYVLALLKEYIEHVSEPEAMMQFFMDNFSGIVAETFAGNSRRDFLQCLIALINFGVQSLKDWNAFQCYSEEILANLLKYAPEIQTRDSCERFFVVFDLAKFCLYLPSFDTLLESGIYDLLRTLEVKESFMARMIKLISTNRENIENSSISRLIEPILLLRKEMIESEIEPTITAQQFSQVLSSVEKSDACELFETMATDDSAPGKTINLFFIESFLTLYKSDTSLDEYLTGIMENDGDFFISAFSIFANFARFKTIENSDLCTLFFSSLEVVSQLIDSSEEEDQCDSAITDIISDAAKLSPKLDKDGLYSFLELISAFMQHGLIKSTDIALNVLSFLINSAKMSEEEISPLVEPISQITSSIFEVDDFSLHFQATLLLSNIVRIIPETYQTSIPPIIDVIMNDIGNEETDLLGISLEALKIIISLSFDMKSFAESHQQPTQLYEEVISKIFEQMPLIMERSELDSNLTESAAADGIKRLIFFFTVAEMQPESRVLMSYVWKMLMLLLSINTISVDKSILDLAEQIINFSDQVGFDISTYINTFATALPSMIPTYANSWKFWYLYKLLFIVEKRNNQIILMNEKQENLLDAAIITIQALIRENNQQSDNLVYEVINYVLMTISFDEIEPQYLQKVIEWVSENISFPVATVSSMALIVLGKLIGKGLCLDLIDSAIPVAMHFLEKSTVSGWSSFLIDFLENIEEIDATLLQEMGRLSLERLGELGNESITVAPLRNEIIAICIKLVARGIIEPQVILEAILCTQYRYYSSNFAEIIEGFLLERYGAESTEEEAKMGILANLSFYFVFYNQEMGDDMYNAVISVLAQVYTATGSLEFSRLMNQPEIDALKKALDDFINPEEEEESKNEQ